MLAEEASCPHVGREVGAPAFKSPLERKTSFVLEAETGVQSLQLFKPQQVLQPGQKKTKVAPEEGKKLPLLPQAREASPLARKDDTPIGTVLPNGSASNNPLTARRGSAVGMNGDEGSGVARAQDSKAPLARKQQTEQQRRATLALQAARNNCKALKTKLVTNSTGPPINTQHEKRWEPEQTAPTSPPTQPQPSSLPEAVWSEQITPTNHPRQTLSLTHIETQLSARKL
jgi:hypothetical protein